MVAAEVHDAAADDHHVSGPIPEVVDVVAAEVHAAADSDEVERKDDEQTAVSLPYTDAVHAQHAQSSKPLLHTVQCSTQLAYARWGGDGCTGIGRIISQAVVIFIRRKLVDRRSEIVEGRIQIIDLQLVPHFTPFSAYSGITTKGAFVKAMHCPTDLFTKIAVVCINSTYI